MISKAFRTIGDAFIMIGYFVMCKLLVAYHEYYAKPEPIPVRVRVKNDGIPHV